MLPPCVLTIVKASLKQLYDIEPMAVDHLLLGLKMQASFWADRSLHLFEGAVRIVRHVIPALQGGESAIA